MPEPVQKKSPAVKAMFIIIILILIGVVISNRDKKNTVEAAPVKNTEVDSVDVSKYPAPDSTAFKSLWDYREETDNMTSKSIYYASITANSLLEFDFPYNGGSVATLVVRKKDGRTDCYLKISKGQFNSTYDGGKARIRFDEGLPKNYSFTGASDASTDVIFFDAVKDIIANLKKSHRAIIEAEFYSNGRQQMEFSTKGFAWDH